MSGGLRALWVHLRSLVGPTATAQDVDQELQYHLAREAERHAASGMSTEDARAAARRAFGNVTAIAESARAASRWRVVDDLSQDLRQAARALLLRPGLTLVVVLTLAIGIGANSVVFSFLNLLFQRLPVRDPASLVTLTWTRGGVLSRTWFTHDDFQSIRAQAGNYTGIVATSGVQPLILGSDANDVAPDKIYAEFVSDGYFALLGATMSLGRPLADDENRAPGAARVVVLSHRFWRARFGGDSSVIGRTLRLNGQSFAVVGVAAPAFVGEGFGFRAPVLWVPMMMRGEMAQGGATWFSGPDNDWLQLIGRLKPGHTLGDAQREAAALGMELRRGHPDADPRAGIGAFSAVMLNAGTGSDLALIIMVGMLMPGLVLLIACANVANVLLARAISRRKEIAVRLSLGAGRGRLMRQLLAEGLLLATLGAVAAIALTWLVLRAFALGMLTQFGARDPVTAASRITVDARVMAVTALVTLAAALAFALVPALRATRTDLVRALKDDGGSPSGTRSDRSRLRHGLVVFQVAISLLFLITATSLLRWMTQLGAANTGLDVPHAVVVDVRPSLLGYDSARVDRFEELLAARIAALPGVRSTGRAWVAPFEGNLRSDVGTADAGAGVRRVGMNMVTPGFFAAVGLPVTRGRVFANDESHGTASVTVVSAAMARVLWPGDDPIGKMLRWVNGGPRTPGGIGSDAFLRVVGVAADAHVARLGTNTQLYFYVPLPPLGGQAGSDPVVIAHVDGNPRAVLAVIRTLVRELDPAMWSAVYPMGEALIGSEEVSVGRGIGTAAAVLGLIAILLASVGLYGVMAFSVSQRTREIGIRTALGASTTTVVGTILASGMRLVAIGGLIGVATALAVSRWLAALLFGLRPFDPVAFGATAMFLGVVALAAIYIPARRAARVDPVLALKHA